eukprot:Rmarinus@m.18023
MASFLSVLEQDLRFVSMEARKKEPKIKDKAERAILKVRSIIDLDVPHEEHSQQLQTDEVLTPFVLACQSKYSKIAVVAIGDIQKLLAHDAVAPRSLGTVLSVLRYQAETGEEAAQLKCLQTLLTLLTSKYTLNDDELREILETCFRLHSSKRVVVHNTATATLRQVISLLLDRVVEEEKNAVVLSEPSSSQVPQADRKMKMRPLTRSAYMLLQDLCFLANGDPGTWMNLSSLSKPFALDIVGSILGTQCYLFREIPEFSKLIRERICSLIIKTHRMKLEFPVILRVMRIIIAIITNYFDTLVTECEIFLSLLVKSCDAKDSPLWYRTLTLEALCAVTSQPKQVLGFFRSYDMVPSSTNVVADLVSVTSRSIRSFLSVPEIVPTFSAGILTGQKAIRLLAQQGDPEPNTSDGYAFSVTARIMFNLVDAIVYPTTTAAAVKDPDAFLDEAMIPASSPADWTDPATARGMAEVGWGGSVGALSAMVTEFDGAVAASLLSCLESFACAAGLLGLPGPRDGLLRALAHHTLTRVQAQAVAAGNEGSPDEAAGSRATSPSPSGPPASHPPASHSSAATLPANTEPPSQTLRRPSNTTGGTGGGTGPTSSQQATSSGDSAGHPPSGTPALPVITQKNGAAMLALFRAVARQSRHLDDAWSFVLERFDMLDTVLLTSAKSGAALRAGQASGLKLVTPQEIQQLQEALNQVFVESSKLDDRALLVLVRALCSWSDSSLAVQASLFSSHAANTSDAEIQMFGLSKLVAVVNCNLHRAGPVWETVTSHLARASRHVHKSIRSLAVAHTRDLCSAILSLPMYSGGTTESDTATPPPSPSPTQPCQRLSQRDVLLPLAALYSPDVAPDVRDGMLRALFELLQSRGDALDAEGWPVILQVLRSPAQSHIKPTDTTPRAFIVGKAPEPARAAADSNSIAPESTTTGSAARDEAPVETIEGDGQGEGKDTERSVERQADAMLVALAFKSVELVTTDFLSTLPVACLISLLDVIKRYAAQGVDANISLTAIGSLWAAADFLAKDSGAICEAFEKSETDPAGLFPPVFEVGTSREPPQRGVCRRLLLPDLRGVPPPENFKWTGQAFARALWLALYSHLHSLCVDGRPTVRNSAVRTLFQTLLTHGSYLGDDKGAWQLLLWGVMFPVVDDVRAAGEGASDVALQGITLGTEKGRTVKMLLHHSRDTSQKQWDETRVLALTGLARTVRAFYGRLRLLPNFMTTWDALLSITEMGVAKGSVEVAGEAVKALEELVLSVLKSGSTDSPESITKPENTSSETPKSQSPSSESPKSPSPSSPVIGAASSSTEETTVGGLGRDQWHVLWDVYENLICAIDCEPSTQASSSPCWLSLPEGIMLRPGLDGAVCGLGEKVCTCLVKSAGAVYAAAAQRCAGFLQPEDDIRLMRLFRSAAACPPEQAGAASSSSNSRYRTTALPGLTGPQTAVLELLPKLSLTHHSRVWPAYVRHVLGYLPQYVLCNGSENYSHENDAVSERKTAAKVRKASSPSPRKLKSRQAPEPEKRASSVRISTTSLAWEEAWGNSMECVRGLQAAVVGAGAGGGGRTSTALPSGGANTAALTVTVGPVMADRVIQELMRVLGLPETSPDARAAALPVIVAALTPAMMERYHPLGEGDSPALRLPGGAKVKAKWVRALWQTASQAFLSVIEAFPVASDLQRSGLPGMVLDATWECISTSIRSLLHAPSQAMVLRRLALEAAAQRESGAGVLNTTADEIDTNLVACVVDVLLKHCSDAPMHVRIALVQCLDATYAPVPPKGKGVGSSRALTQGHRPSLTTPGLIPGLDDTGATAAMSGPTDLSEEALPKVPNVDLLRYMGVREVLVQKCVNGLFDLCHCPPSSLEPLQADGVSGKVGRAANGGSPRKESISMAAKAEDSSVVVARIATPILLRRCDAALASYVADERKTGECPLARRRLAEVQLLLSRLRTLSTDRRALGADAPAIAKQSRTGRGLLLSLYRRLCDCVTLKETALKGLVAELLVIIGSDAGLIPNVET